MRFNYLIILIFIVFIISSCSQKNRKREREISFQQRLEIHPC